MSSWEKFSSEIVEGKKKPALDPVGKEDADINNDGKEDETDSYLRNRRKIRSRIIRKEDYENIEEKAVSKAQQRFFGMVRAAQKGEMEDPSPEVSKAAASMSKSDVKDFAKTKHDKLPEKKETKEETSLVADIVENLRAQRLKRQAKREVAQAKQARRTSAYKNKTLDDLLTKGKVNDAAGKSKRVEVKAPANVKGGAKKSSDEPDLGTVPGRAEERRRASKVSAELRRQEDRTKRSGLAAQLRGERTRQKEAKAAAAERRAGRDAAARENEVKRARELKGAKIDAKSKQDAAFMDTLKKEVGDGLDRAGSRAAVKKDDTGGQALRNLEVGGDLVGGLAKGLVGGAMAKRQAKKDRLDDLKKRREVDRAGRAAGKRFDMGKKAEADAKADMEKDADDNLTKFLKQKPPKSITDPYKDGKGRSDVVKAGGIGAEGSVRSKGGSMGGEGSKGTAIPGSTPKPALAPAKPGSPAISGGARALAKVSDVVSKPKSERKFSPRGEALRKNPSMRAKVSKELGMGSAKRPKPKGFGEGFSNWRVELNESFFLQEVEDVENNGLHSNIKKLVDISKKKNKIEINPPLGEGALPVKPIVGSFAQGEAGKGDSNRTMGDVAKRRIRRKLVDWASQKAGEKAEDIVKDILDKKKEGEEVKEDWQKVNRKDKTDGLSQKAVDAYRKENPGSKLQTAVTEKKPTGKRADRRKSFCRRMKGMKAKLTSKKTSRDPDSRINKALRRWNCN